MNLREIANPQVKKEKLESVAHYLKKAYLQLQLKNPYNIPGLLKNYSTEYLAKYIAGIFAPPTTPAEEKIQLLADWVIALIFPEKEIDSIIPYALIEIEDAHKVILRSGGGWSRRVDPDKRKKAVLDWYQYNQDKLSYLKEIHLQDIGLYNYGGGQEKRNFISRLLIKILKDKVNKDITFKNINEYKRKFKNITKPLHIEDL